MKTRLACGLAIGLLFGAASCAPPSPEQIATMTAAAWTPTPAPTATPTPIPYSLTVHIADELGSPIAGASLILPESGSPDPVQTDPSGVYTWPDVQGPNASISASAPGYYHALQPVTLERGSSEMVLILQRDPSALLAADACGPGEKLLYMEDFQAGATDKWRATAGEPSMWVVVTEETGNSAGALQGVGNSQAELIGPSFDNVVWRVKIKASGSDGDAFLNFRHTLAGGDQRYLIQWGANPSLAMVRFDGAAGTDTRLGLGQFKARPGTWYYVELSYYEGALQAWVDGQKQIEAQDATPLPPGTIGLEAHIPSDPNTQYLIDDISVCELSAPFSASLFKPPSQ